jgi:hypothetical protein
MYNARSALTGWIARGLVALAILAGISRIGPDLASSHSRLPSITPPAPRVIVAGPVASVLNVRQPMRYGEFLWNDEGVPQGPVSVRVDRRAQLLSVFRAGHEIGTAVILYGANEKPTPAGRYPILAKLRQHRSSTYDADMPYTLRLTGDGIALHASEVRPGAATHGCIGLPPAFARKLFDAAAIGDPVTIV